MPRLRGPSLLREMLDGGAQAGRHGGTFLERGRFRQARWSRPSEPPHPNETTVCVAACGFALATAASGGIHAIDNVTFHRKSGLISNQNRDVEKRLICTTALNRAGRSYTPYNDRALTISAKNMGLVQIEGGS